MEKIKRVKRSETWIKIWEIVKTLPLERTNDDAPDPFSVTTDIEQLFLKLLPIHGVVKSLNTQKTNPNFDEWLQTHEKFKDNTYVWRNGHIMSFADMKVKHKELIELDI